MTCQTSRPRLFFNRYDYLISLSSCGCVSHLMVDLTLKMIHIHEKWLNLAKIYDSKIGSDILYSLSASFCPALSHGISRWWNQSVFSQYLAILHFVASPQPNNSLFCVLRQCIYTTITIPRLMYMLPRIAAKWYDYHKVHLLQYAWACREMCRALLVIMEVISGHCWKIK